MTGEVMRLMAMNRESLEVPTRVSGIGSWLSGVTGKALGRGEGGQGRAGGQGVVERSDKRAKEWDLREKKGEKKERED